MPLVIYGLGGGHTRIYIHIHIRTTVILRHCGWHGPGVQIEVNMAYLYSWKSGHNLPTEILYKNKQILKLTTERMSIYKFIKHLRVTCVTAINNNCYNNIIRCVSS